MSDEEEDDLELLRSAALASIGKKSKNESEDLEALRKMALTSRKSQGQDLLEKLQPAKQSNLISLTPNPNNLNNQSPDLETNRSDSNNDSKKSDVEDVSDKTFSSCESDSSSEDDEGSNPSKQEQQHNNNNDSIEIRAEEDDILNAIDQFLDEGVIMLEQVDETPIKKAENKKEIVKSTKKKSKIKAPKDKKPKNVNHKKKTEKQQVNESTNSLKKKVSQAIPRDSCNPNPARNEGIVRNSTQNLKQQLKPEIVPDRTFKHEMVEWDSNDLPLHDKRKPQTRSDSVHSSDLSFLSDSEKNNRSIEQYKTENRSPHSDGRYIRINKEKLDQLQRDSIDNRRPFRLVKKNASISPPPQTTKPGRDLPDLREKLKQRGLHRRKHSNEKEENDIEDNGEVGSQLIEPKRIYIKPTVGYRNRDRSYTRLHHDLNEQKKERQRLIVTREVNDNIYSPIKVRIDDEDSKEVFQNFRRKRSVVPYKPEEPLEEKQMRLDKIKKKVEQSVVAESCLDLSEDFDDFEIEEPNSSSSEKEKSPEGKKSVGKAVVPSTEIRRLVSSSPRPKRKRSESPLSDYDENIDKLEHENVNRLPLESSDDSMPDEDGNPVQVRSKIKLANHGSILANNIRLQRSRERRVAHSQTSRAKKSAIDPKVIRKRGDRTRETVESNNSNSPPIDQKQSYRRKRRINVAVVDEASLKKSVKHRLGFNKPESRRHGSRHSQDSYRLEKEDIVRKKADREKVVDARILQINQKNAEILKRRRMIEMEEKQFRMKT